MKNKISKLLMMLVAGSALFTGNNALAKPAQTFSNVFTFGDSFSMPVNSWAALVTEHYGFVNNQTNFALGGATTADLNTELNNYKTTVKNFDPNALYMMYMGPSDINRLYTEIQLDMFDLTEPFYQIIDKLQDGSLKLQDFPNTRTVTKLTTIEQDAGEFIKNIVNSGATYIVVLNHFNEFYRQQDTALIGRNDVQKKFFEEFLSNLFNQAIYSGINKFAPSANVIYADYARLIQELISKPSDFFTADELVNTRKNQGVFIAEHPTAATQKITAQYVLSIIESPSRIAYIREIPIVIGENVVQNIHSMSYDLIMNDHEKFSGNINGNYIGFNTKTKTPKNLGIKNSNTSEIDINLNYKVKDNLVVGFGINGDKSDMSFKGNNGKAEIKELLLTLNSTYKFDNPIFVYGAVGGGLIKYDIKRQIQLGQNTRTEQGKPRGRHYIATIGTGYQYNILPTTNLTPFVNVNYQKVSVNPYTEIGKIRSTTMSFNIPDRKSVITEIGAKIEGNFGMKERLLVTPSLILTYGYDFINSIEKQAKGRASDMPKQFEVPTYKMDSSYFNINGGLTAQTNNMHYGIKAGSKLSKNTKLWSAGLFFKYLL